MDYASAAYLRANSRAWRLLRADSAPLILHVLGQIFIVDNVRMIAEPDLLTRVDDLLYAVNSATLTEDGSPPYPRTARAYVDSWADPDAGWLRKFYPEGSQEAHYDATVDVEKAYAFLTGLASRTFIGTQSRLQTIVELLRDIVTGADPDPDARLAELRKRRDELDAEIAAFDGTRRMDPVAILDRYQHFSSTARELLSDFRAVEENFRGLDRQIRADIAAWDGSKGELLDQIIGERHAIADSDQGRSFQAFHDFLLSRSRRDELTDLLERLVELEEIEVDRSLGRVHFDWLDAAERTQQTVRLLSEQLRRFLDDKVWLENRRVVELLRSIERSALAVRDQNPALTMELDAASPEVRLAFERPLYAPTTFHGVDSAGPVEEDEPLAWDALFDQVHVDIGRLTSSVRATLRHRDQVGLDRLLDEHPATQGVAELIAYLGLVEDDFDVVIDDSSEVRIAVTDAEGRARAVRMPQVLLVRSRSTVGGRR
ncbi:MAG: DUF3375 domain-containing protein [Dermatophilaceae bacterium]|nr:DUF3375 domain-containing protein [Intrasporangiaceae bacterium]